MAAPEFSLFVRSVEGYAVPRYGTTELLGADRIPRTKEQRLAGEPTIIWSTQVIPLHRTFVSAHLRELNGHIRRGELELCTKADWDSQCAMHAAIEAAIAEPDSAAEVAEKDNQ